MSRRLPNLMNYSLFNNVLSILGLHMPTIMPPVHSLIRPPGAYYFPDLDEPCVPAIQIYNKA